MHFTAPLALSAMIEVSDKVSTIADLLVEGALIGGVLFVASRIRWWLSILGLMIWADPLSNTLWLLRDGPGDLFGKEMLAEQGMPYLAGAMGSDLLVIVGALAGAELARRQRLSARACARIA